MDIPGNSMTKYQEWSTEELIEEAIYRELGGPGDAWSPIHALHLLGCIKTPEALHLLIGVLRNRGKELGDWLTCAI